MHENLLFLLRNYSHLFAHTYVVISCLNRGTTMEVYRKGAEAGGGAKYEGE